MNSDIKSNLLNAEIWLRLIFIVLFWVVLGVVGWVLGPIIVVQFVIVLFTGEQNTQLTSFGSRLGTYLNQIVSYLCFSSDEKPFPFADFPGEAVTQQVDDQ